MTDTGFPRLLQTEARLVQTLISVNGAYLRNGIMLKAIATPNRINASPVAFAISTPRGIIF